MLNYYMNKEKTLEEKYPSVELAYPIAVASYDVASKRLDVMDGRLQTILTFVVSVSAAILPLAGSRGVSFRSYWFYAATAIFFITVALGTYARLCGEIKVLKPEMLFNNWLHKSEWEFKKDFLSFASDDFNHNLALSERKWKYSAIITFLFFAEVVAAAVWANV